MSWSDERVELLRKLWTDGLSASQIASELGGITRNAVIGKVHRLKLSGRARPVSSVVRIRKHRTQNRVSANNFQPAYRGNTALKQDTSPRIDFEADPLSKVVPIGPRVSITELTDSTCRWPVGDPGSEEFGYCGAKPKMPFKLGEVAGIPYCPYHARIAYQPLADRRRERRASMAR